MEKEQTLKDYFTNLNNEFNDEKDHSNQRFSFIFISDEEEEEKESKE